ncbi:acyltransferase [Nocardioides szechwanensis]|uniref:Peptidoglycan/LPS O-acetylase OafA/YrhL, contains acyltransferase and SGNH-hydrolase domains n=2 Tax=Nocardioides szechwanensis TaxID=1005944 RepID=A0A1G9WBM4_9ACTN|nr:acyltransferase [Nocardioides szechwanensis]SDM81948.1 Peptidoglycan/LPS O-acetylase OafA/YrhL, contains acyltransferase and SGNH-hydrolase domains [Nocardioides szechwanensis]
MQALTPTASEPHRQRADIQGLRAIAVLVVIASHYGLPGLGGGYVGVDVFFVISGFLITQLLLREADRSGTLSLPRFYARRARRILPAATLVLVATVAVSLVLLPANELLDVSGDAVWATFFAANIHFAAVGTDYFDQDRVLSPLQHFWSLSVEEQFYLAWPLILLGCVLLTRWRRPDRTDQGPRGLSRAVAVPILLAVVAASFGYGAVAAGTDATNAYFSTFARAWELGVGAAVALVLPVVRTRLRPAARTALAVAGLAAIAFACVSFGGHVQVSPSAMALPVLGAGALLLAGAEVVGREPVSSRLLGVPPMRVVGDWSYSLYLWHWPLLVLAERDGEVSAPVRLGLVGATFLLSYLTYRFVETPFRNPRNPRNRSVRRGLLLYPATAVGVVLVWGTASVYAHYLVGGFGDDPAITVGNSGIRQDTSVDLSKDRAVALVQASLYAADQGAAIPSSLRPSPLELDEAVAGVGDCDYSPPDARQVCPRGDPTGERTLVLWGDSHAQMWISAFDELAREHGYRAYYFVKPLCGPADLSIGHENAPDAGPWDGCPDFREWVVDRVAELSPDLTVLAGAGPNVPIYGPDGQVTASQDRGDLLQAGWERSFDAVAPYSDSVALLRDVPWANRNAAGCLTRRGADLSDCTFTPDRGHERDAYASLRAAESRDVRVVRPEPWLCWRDRCTFVVGDMVTYTDNNHVTAVYAESLAEELGRALGVPLDLGRS